MLTHLDLHRDATHARGRDVVARDTRPASASGDEAAAGRATITSADARGSAPGLDAGLARSRDRLALYLRGSRNRWRQWTSLVAVAVHSVGDRLRDGLTWRGGVRGASSATPVDPPYPLDPYAGAVARSVGRVHGEAAAPPRAVPTALPIRRSDDLGDERPHDPAVRRPPRDGG